MTLYMSILPNGTQNFYETDAGPIEGLETIEGAEAEEALAKAMKAAGEPDLLAGLKRPGKVKVGRYAGLTVAKAAKQRATETQPPTTSQKEG